MLRSMNDLENCAIQATDGVIGHVKDFYFDDEEWVIRYLIVETGTWLSSRKVLISPIAIGHPNWAQKVLPVTLTKEQIKNSPDIDTDEPVSRQHEMRYFGYYGYSCYWGSYGLWGTGMSPGMLIPGYAGFAANPNIVQSEADKAHEQEEAARHKDDDPHLRSCKAVIGYHIKATDGDIGHVHGFLVDEETWAIRYIIVNTSNWWLGHELLIAPKWILNVSWAESSAYVNVTRQIIKDAPPYDSAAQLDRAQEIRIHEYYGRSGYWADEMQRQSARSQQ